MQHDVRHEISSTAATLLLLEVKLLICYLVVAVTMSHNADDKPDASLKEDMVSKRRKELFGDCALIEIIHLHDCLRGALKTLEADVNALATEVQKGGRDEQVADLERRVAGRFKVIWSVFRAHSSAEDEFIWPALQSKTLGRIRGSTSKQQEAGESAGADRPTETQDSSEVIEQEEYEEDHADEERMFSEMDTLLTKLREVLVRQRQSEKPAISSTIVVDDMARDISERTKMLSQHLMTHLEKEETQCMPLVVKHLSKVEIHDLVGQIMGKRSADTIAQIMTMAVQSLDEADREDMVKYMKQSMAGTFFDRWLLMSGWGSSSKSPPKDDSVKAESEKKRPAKPSLQDPDDALGDPKRPKVEETAHSCDFASATVETATSKSKASGSGIEITSQAELEKLIRAIATNPALSAEQKNTTIQGLRDSVWKSNQREKEKRMSEGPPTIVNTSVPKAPPFLAQRASSSDAPLLGTSSSANSRTRRVTPPSMYYKKTKEGTYLKGLVLYVE